MTIKSKLTNYFLDIPSIQFVACGFDPPNRIDYLSDYLNIYYKNLGLEVDIDDKIREINKLIINLYSH